MGLLNFNQIQPGARRYNKDNAYVVTGVTEKPTDTVLTQSVAASGNFDIFTINGGTIEFDGKEFSLDGVTLNMTNLGTLVSQGKKLIVAAVPKYTEPANASAAETEGVNYYVNNEANGEGVVYPFVSPTVKAAADSLGGYSSLQQKVYKGVATAQETTVYHQYEEELQRLTNPRYGVFPIAPTGVDVILVDVSAQKNYYAEANVLFSKTLDEFRELQSQLPQFYVERRVESGADAIALYTGYEHLIISAKSYASAADAASDTGGTVLDISSGVASTIFGAAAFVAVKEYAYPAHMALGQRGEKPVINRWLTRTDSAYLGRTNPLYLYAEAPSVRFEKLPYSPLTKYPDPCPLLEITLGANLSITIDKEVYEGFYN